MSEVLTFNTEAELAKTPQGHSVSDYDGEGCTVVRELDSEDRDAEVGPMYRIKFIEDGVEIDAFWHELTRDGGVRLDSEYLTFNEETEMWEGS